MSELEADSTFVRELKTGHRWQLWVGYQFLREGFVVRVPPLEIRHDRSQIDEYSDEGDLFISCNSSHLNWLRFECKSRDLTFTGRSDYPFTTAFVDRVQTWNRKQKSRPAGILMVSQKTRAILAIGAWTEHEWRVEKKHDSVRNYDRSYYLVDRGHLIDWPDLVSRIKGQLPVFSE